MIQLGVHGVDLVCPACGEMSETTAILSTVLQRESEDQGKARLKLKVKTQTVEHVCGQISISRIEGAAS